MPANSAQSVKRATARSLNALLIALLVACGGGGSDGGGNNGAEAPLEASAAVDGSLAGAKNVVTMILDTEATASANHSNVKNISPSFDDGRVDTFDASNRPVQLKLDQTDSCSTDYPAGEPYEDTERTIVSCTGTIRTVTDFDEVTDGDPYEVGRFIEITYNDVVVLLDNGDEYKTNGTTRSVVIETLTFQPANNDPLGIFVLVGKIRVKYTNFSVVDQDGSFGPIDREIDITFDEKGRASYVDSGIRYIEFEARKTDNSYTIVSGSTIAPSEGGYLETEFNNWQSIDGVRSAGSAANVIGTGSTATVQVATSDESRIRYAVQITSNGSTTSHVVSTVKGADGVYRVE